MGVAATVIMGDDEIKAGTATLRSMSDAHQETVPLPDLIRRLKASLSRL